MLTWWTSNSYRDNKRWSTFGLAQGCALCPKSNTPFPWLCCPRDTTQALVPIQTCTTCYCVCLGQTYQSWLKFGSACWHFTNACALNARKSWHSSCRNSCIWYRTEYGTGLALVPRPKKSRALDGMQTHNNINMLAATNCTIFFYVITIFLVYII